MRKIFYLVAVNIPLNNGVLSYFQEIKNEDEIYQIGSWVRIPIKKKIILGLILEANLSEDKIKASCSIEDVREIISLTSERLGITTSYLNFLEWTSKYYHYNLGQLIDESLPKKNLKLKDSKIQFLKEGKGLDFPFSLSIDQEEVIVSIEKKFEKKTSQIALLHGVTGSGKTLVFLHLLKKVIEQENKPVLLLVPEINLTPQYAEFFINYLYASVIIYHGSMSPNRKFQIWKYSSECNDRPFLIIGTRSSIFLPIEKFGLIIVDEEHDSSYKQEHYCPYNARDLAILRAHQNNINILLSSATPSLESFDLVYYNRKNKVNVDYFSMSNRIMGNSLPEIKILKSSFSDPHWPFTEDIIKSMKETLKQGEQVVVFLNRLGHSTYLECSNCDHVFNCHNCSIAMKFYKARSELVCSFCNLTTAFRPICPDCGCTDIFHKGYGTEKVKEILENIFPSYVIQRFDRDELKNLKKVEEVLNKFHKNEINILVGTQMISKGHNFEKVNNVIILGIDSLLNFPDYRSEERIYQLVTQVAGRSGRFSNRGIVHILTTQIENEIWTSVKNKNMKYYYAEEMNKREAFQLPPFYKASQIYLISSKKELLQDFSKEISSKISELKIHEELKESIISYPRPCLVERRENKYYWNIFIKTPNSLLMNRTISYLLLQFKNWKKIKFFVDVDPYNFL